MMLKDYAAALVKLHDDPLTLTDTDFAVLENFNPKDAERGRALVREKQLRIVALHTKAMAPPTVTAAERMADVVEICIKEAVKPFVDRLHVQKKEIATLQERVTHMHAIVQKLEQPDDPDTEIDRAQFDRAH